MALLTTTYKCRDGGYADYAATLGRLVAHLVSCCLSRVERAGEVRGKGIGPEVGSYAGEVRMLVVDRA